MVGEVIKVMINLYEYSNEKIRDVKNLLSHEELKWLKGEKHKSMDIWSEFPYFQNKKFIRFILNRLNDDI
jgi:hypothetical protein